ncbi:SDR family NAD(P)-dependent oxidoreductase [Streptomyces sp. NPDC055089]
MNLNGAGVLVAGATGFLGGALAAEPADRGARPVLAGRDRARLAKTAQARPGAPTVLFDAYDPASCARAVHGAATGPGGLDAVVTAFGSVAFGRATEVGDEAAEYPMAVNALASAAFFRAALGIMRPGSMTAAFTGVVAARPQAGMADYSASQAAMGARLGSARREARTAGIRALDVRPGHLDTGFADRPVSGTAPPMPAGGNPRQLVGAVADAIEADAARVRTSKGGTPVVERRAR